MKEGMVVLILSLVLGVLNCFWGYKMLKFWVTAFGFVLGAGVGHYLGNSMGGDNFIFSVAGMVIFGILLALIAFKVYLGGVFILCGGIAYLIFFQIAKPDAVSMYVLGIVIAIAVGILGTFFVKPVVIITTSIQGGFSVGGGIYTIMNLKNDNTGFYIGIVLVVCGIIVQFMTNKKKE